MNDELLAVPRATLRALFDAVIAGDEEGLAGHAPEMVKVRDMLDAPQPPVGGEPSARVIHAILNCGITHLEDGRKVVSLDAVERALETNTSAYTTLAAERDALQSELTKAQELLAEVAQGKGLSSDFDVRAKSVLAHQPAPAANAVFNDPLYNAESDARNASAMLEEVLELFDDGVGRSPEEFKLMRRIGGWLGRSAPAAKGEGDEA
ncbi:hypothetical protein [Pseudomonas typographi]|uniref:HPt domain-containing protein n=1 Tax=Pseudomonas typographi TaxID=2715964 RepID=A0ABR7ZAT1_9PSED|nr:hypothetical protein [Pseudomonas typographi]MBD1602409.1 hypothetical protein [Pseudomonas typographi]